VKIGLHTADIVEHGNKYIMTSTGGVSGTHHAGPLKNRDLVPKKMNWHLENNRHSQMKALKNRNLCPNCRLAKKNPKIKNREL